MSKIRLWWHLNEGKSNFGDILNPYLVEKISGREAKWSPIKRFSLFKTYVVIGSVLNIANRNCIVWGAGIISRDSDVPKSTFLAVRGPESGKRLVELGHKDPRVYGDPALLLPKYYQPKIKSKTKIGIIPHYVDLEKVSNWALNGDFKIINLLNENPEEVIDEIASCEYTISSSLHGIIVSHAYGVKSMWSEFSHELYGDGVKFLDYFQSVGIEEYKPLAFYNSIPSENEVVQEIERFKTSYLIRKNLEEISADLLEVCPFKND